MATNPPQDEQMARAGQSVAAYIEKKWGGPIRSLPLAAVAVSGTAPTRALTNNPRRFAYLIVNPSTGNVYWGTTPTDAALNAVLIMPLGGSLVVLVDEDGEMPTQEAWLNSAASLTCYVLEVIRK